MRVRATVLVVRHDAVLLVRQRGGPWYLPGGEVRHNELVMAAAIRELHEGTGAEASAAAFMWQHVSAQHLHHVFRVAIPADARLFTNPGQGVDEVRWVNIPLLHTMPVTPGTKAILARAAGINGGVGRAPPWANKGFGAGRPADF
ncbi:NUDIX domain-containing protein [Caballeronia sp. GAFFF2]|uniref:NUDIX domain-containing protein n=1 Tax=Caballeronia sp. GAFFF2 TaxID=2921741 RepID=UPI002027B251|nr:NUDIX domain-containing protein [Caballeronia sp. GAFFF2]